MPMSLNLMKEQLSIAYIKAVAAAAGCSCLKVEVDNDNIDILLMYSGSIVDDGFESPQLQIQAKSTSRNIMHDELLHFPLPIGNYNGLRGNTLVPRILVVLMLPSEPENWISQNEEQMIIRKCAYWKSLNGEPSVSNDSNVMVHIPRNQVFSPMVLNDLMTKVARGNVYERLYKTIH